MTTPVIFVAGTNAWTPGGKEWFTPPSPFIEFLTAHEVAPYFGDDVVPRPFCWSTDLGGLPGAHRFRGWQSAGVNLYDYIVPPRNPIPPAQTNLIVHSHGLQVALFACEYGLRVNTLISVGSPIRADMLETAQRARPRIGFWLHIYSDWTDRWQWFGELFDHHLGIVRKAPLADMNDFVPKVGHSELLRLPKHFHYWEERGWLHTLKSPVTVAV